MGKLYGRLPWFGWFLLPLILPAALVVLIPLSVLAAFSIPYYFIFPDHHRHLWDFEGTIHQRALLTRQRALYSRLGFLCRIHRAFARRTACSVCRRNSSVV